MSKLFRVFFVFSVLASCCNFALSELITFDADDANAWNVFQDDDTFVEFGFDYSGFGIPEPPNGGGTTGIQVAANINDGFAAAIAVSPKDFEASGKYTIAADIWLNYFADLENRGTTEYGGLFVGFDSVSEGTIIGAGLIADGDGDARQDYQLHNNGSLVAFDTGQYSIESQNSVDDPALVEAFPSAEVPEIQTDFDVFDPPNEFGASQDGALGFAWHTWIVEVDSDAGTAKFSIDGVDIGILDASVEDDLNLEGPFALAYTDIFTSVSPNPIFSFGIIDNVAIDIGDVETPGDYNGNGELDIDDINTLGAAIQAGSADSQFDLNADGDVDNADLKFWVIDLRNTWIGDSNLDGEFSSTDFVKVFQQGEYEDAIAANSTWDEGDWNNDGDFDSSDFVAAFQDGGFEQGPRTNAAAVPEPSVSVFVLTILVMFIRRKA